jgi:methylated-DNA-protein-cysteine methyltransferase-like protein
MALQDAYPSRQEMIWLVVSQIPAGRAVSYGEVARRAGLAGMARYVGYALGQLPGNSQVPWFRVVNSQRRISFPPGSAQADRQKELLEADGVVLMGYRVTREYFEG